jgi:Ni/Co efflux regulator RcnB
MKRAFLLAAALTAALPAVPALARPGDDGRHYVNQHGRWARGQVLPSRYRTRSYVVSDYRHYRLRPPPRGYYYVRNGDDVLLTAIASGIISAVLGDAAGGGYRGSYYEEEVVYGGRGPRGGRSYGGSSVSQGPGGQTIYSEGRGGSSYTSQGPGGQTIVTDGPNGRTITRQGPGGQSIETVPYN